MLEEIPLEDDDTPPREGERRLARRLLVGLAFDLDLVPGKLTRAWQDTVREGTFDPEACTDDVLSQVALDPDDPRLVDRSGTLLRDFCMSGLVRGARGAGRRAKRVAQDGLALLISQGLALGIFSLIFLACLLVLRLRGVSLDGWLDRLLFR